MSRRLTVALGVGLALFGLAAVFVPGLVAGVSLNEVVILGIGVVLTLGAVSTFRERFRTPREFAEFPDVEESIELPTPGDELDGRLDDISRMRTRRVTRERIRNEVASIAIETLQRRHRVSSDEAETLLRTGEWTDDPYAAAFFTRRLEGVSPREKLRERFRSVPPFQYRARRAAAEIYALAEGDDD